MENRRISPEEIYDSAMNSESMAHAALLVTGEGRRLGMNAAAQSTIHQAQLLTYSHGKIEAVGSAMKLLRLALAAAVAPSPDAGAVVLGHQRGSPAIATISPMRLSNGSRAVIILLEADRLPDQLLVQRLCNLFGLTRAEAEIAAGIGNNMTLRQNAEARQVAVSTVRAQLKQIASKMSCNRQSQIASVVRSIIPG